MIVTFLCGGLGNQMFQYAAGRRLALHRGVELRLDLRDYRTGADDRGPAFADFRRPMKLSELRATVTAATPADVAAVADRHRTSSTADRVVRQVRRAWPTFRRRASHVHERGYRFDPAVLDAPADAYLQGFWQSWRYFADVADVVRAELRPKDDAVVAYAATYVDRLRATGGPVVALHVRRGDLAHAVETLKDVSLVYGPPVGLDYLAAAAARFGPGTRFLVFSDTPQDIDWCKRHVPGVLPDAGRVHYCEGHADVQDMAIMSACDGNVIANSTFSWWAAWLNGTPGRRVVAPRQWATPGDKSGMVTDDLIPPEWEQV